MYWKYLRQKIRYNHPARLLFDGLARTGVQITFYYILQEGLTKGANLFVDTAFPDYEFGFFDEKDMKSIAAIPLRPYSEKSLLERMALGQQCYGAKFNNQIASFTWLDLKTLNFRSIHRKLNCNEGYLFDAYTALAFRGKGLAPYVRYRTYRAMEKLGCTCLYSVSNHLNRQSINFKTKLNANIIEKGVAVDIVGKKQFHIIFKQFNAVGVTGHSTR